jgi:hypothetical protein
VRALAQTIVAELKAKPQQFDEVVDAHRDVPWREFLYAWGEVREANVLQRDDDGAFFIAADA